MATPHARAVYRALDSRRAAIFTPGKNRRRSVRDQRETPRDILRNLGKKLAPNSEQIGSSSSPGLQDTSDLGPVYDDDDDADMRLPDPPRLSLPIDADDSDLEPHKSAGLEDIDLTMKSIEFPRRAFSERPRRLSTTSLGSIRMSDYFGHASTDDDHIIESPFFGQRVLDEAFENLDDEPTAEELTYQRYVSPLSCIH